MWFFPWKKNFLPITKRLLANQDYWPSLTVLSVIYSSGCHVVAKPSKDGDARFEWRQSLSFAEFLLMESIKQESPTAIQVYRTFKQVLKFNLKPPCGIITSYNLKTIFFYACERIHPRLWTDLLYSKCFLGLIDDLINALASRFLPSCFNRKLNLIENIPDDFLNTLSKRLLKLREDPFKFCNLKRTAMYWVENIFHYSSIKILAISLILKCFKGKFKCVKCYS